MTYVPGQFFPYIFLGTKPSAAISQDGRLKSLWARYLINRWMDRFQIIMAGSQGISDDLGNIWEEFIKNKMADEGHFEKNGCPKSLWARYLMNRRLDRIQIWCCG